jgi:hypothetical protein
MSTALEVPVAFDHEYRATAVSSKNFEIIEKSGMLLGWIEGV